VVEKHTVQFRKKSVDHMAHREVTWPTYA
jgi:hypothetical protein